MQISSVSSKLRSAEVAIPETKVQGEQSVAKEQQVQQVQQVQPDLEAERDSKQPSGKFLEEALEKANKATKAHDVKAEFKVHEETNYIMVRIIDTETKEVVREIPPEKMLDLIAKIWDLAGLFVDERG